MTNRERALRYMVEALVDPDEAETLLRIVEAQAYAEGFVKGYGAAEKAAEESEGWEVQTAQE